jgi:predicted NAD/FAD-dependent oxidoreductase/deoxyribodipyrimidine photolyase
MPTEAPTLPADLPPHLRERAHALNDRPVDPTGDFVLCWLHHAIRAHENPALDAAVAIANGLGKPVLVYQGLAGAHRFNSDRHHVFIMQGARDLHRDLRARGVASVFHLPRDPLASSPLRTLIERSCAVITEDFPAPPFPRWSKAHAERSGVAMLALDSACLLPVRALDKRISRAFQFRDAAQETYDAVIAQAWTDVEPEVGAPDTGALDLPFEPVDLEGVDLGALAARCDIDHTIPAIRHTIGGSDAGYARWDNFRDNGLRSYHNRRNDAADLTGVSRLSPYLHHGHVSPFRIAREAHAVGGKGADKFLDELLVWREMSYHYAAHSTEAQLETLDAIPSWARKTLAEHEGDERETIHHWETLSRGRTGDALWDGAQRSLLWAGELHNNVRMTWGKMIPQWTHDADEALRLLIDLNHRYALDGNNPNSYGGLLWSLGQFDRPFKPAKPVLGTVRPRDTTIHAQRLDPEKYNAAIRTHAALPRTRVGVIGAGVAGLACARTLADQGCDVTVIDKGRGPGGRTSTRFEHDMRFDHASPWFEATDPRFGRYARSWIQDGVCAIWKGRFVRAGDEGLVPIEPERPKIVATPGMHALCAHLGADLDVRYATRAATLERDDEAWRVRTTEDDELGPFERVVVALPPTQARELVGDVGGLADPLSAIEESPCWTLMLAAEDAEPPFDALLFDDGPIDLLVRDDAKPGRARTGGETLWVAHASAALSREHLERDADDVAGMMTQTLLPHLGRPAVTHARAHRWRYAHATSIADERCAWSPDHGIACCAAGFGEAGVQGAFLSGQAAAGRVLASRPVGLHEQSPAPSLF